MIRRGLGWLVEGDSSCFFETFRDLWSFVTLIPVVCDVCVGAREAC